MDEVLQEFVTSRGVTMGVDRGSNLIRGVKLLGLDSRNGRRYLPTALANAAPLYEGAKVNVNHPKGHPLAARDYQDRLGTIRGVTFREGAGLFGDLHFNPKHVLAEQLLWDAQNASENVGFSHNVIAHTSREGEQLVVEAIVQVQSVDLVADPATTRGLFEATASESTTVLALREEITSLRAELDALRLKTAVDDRQQLLRRLLVEYHLPDPETCDATGRAIVSEPFLQTVLAANGEAEMRRLVDDRAQLMRHALAGVGRTTPRAREQQSLSGQTAAPQDAVSFARAIVG